MIKARAPLLWRAPASRLINLESEVARAKSQRMDVVRVHEKLYRFLHLVGCEVGGVGRREVGSRWAHRPRPQANQRVRARTLLCRSHHQLFSLPLRLSGQPGIVVDSFCGAGGPVAQKWLECLHPRRTCSDLTSEEILTRQCQRCSSSKMLSAQVDTPQAEAHTH